MSRTTSYTDFRQLTHDYQAHSAAVNTSTTPKVQYGFASGSDNTIRPTTITYPDGRVITYDYGSSGSVADNLSRIASIVDDDVSSTHLADYEYLGLGAFVETDYTEPDIKYTLIGTAGGDDPDTGDIYRGLDRFGRIKDSYWYDYGSSTDVDRIKYGYDRDGNRLWRQNTVAESLGKYFDELYSYDDIDRLWTMDRGDLNGSKTSISNLQFAQDWTLDSTGNWRNFRTDDDGDSTWDLNQQRTNNKVNEITGIAETTGPSWVTPAYDPAGNMTTIPKPADPTTSFTATYDAWNRLVKIVEGSNTVAEYEYDAAKRRTIKKTYDSGTLDETRHLYYTEPSKWQVVEERIDTETDPNRQFVWGLRYIDDIVLRDRDTNDNGTLDERLYGMQDANWNVTGITNSTGTVQERYAYSAYGVTSVMDGNFAVQSVEVYKWEATYCGYRNCRVVMLYFVRHRILNAVLGRWLQWDPARYRDAFSLYTYVASNPIKRVDPSGLGVRIFYKCTLVEPILSKDKLTRDCFYSCDETLRAPVGAGQDDIYDKIPRPHNIGDFKRHEGWGVKKFGVQVTFCAPSECAADYKKQAIWVTADWEARICSKKECSDSCDTGAGVVKIICGKAKGPWKLACKLASEAGGSYCTEFCNAWCQNP